jgi:arylsulfatase A-like enzyme
VILFYVDGLRADVLEELAAGGELPRLREHVLDRGVRVRSAVTSVPSVTYANAVSMLTGAWPSTHGVWANASFDRDRLLTRNYEVQRERAVGDDSSTTIFELMPGELTAGIALPFERGVKISRARSAESGGMEFGLSWIMGQEEEADECLVEQFYDIGEQARRIGEWPAFIAVHLPGVDKVGHDQGSDGQGYRDAIVNLDQAIGDLLDVFERGGMLDELTLVLTSDHGHHSTPMSLALDEFLPEALGVPVLISLENDGDVPFLERWERYQAARVVGIPNGMREASVHLRTGESWSERPSLEEILGFPFVFGPTVRQDLPERLLRSPGIDLVAVRAGEHRVHVYGRSGAAVIERTGHPRDPSFSYERLAGSDPLGYDGDDRLRQWIDEGAHTSREWLAATAGQRYPDLVPQLVTAFDASVSGDLLLFAAPAWDFSAEYGGGHGGVEREEMIVPLYLAGPGIPAGVVLPAARLVDVVPTLLDLAGAPALASHFDGVSLMHMFGKETAQVQE